MDEVIQEIWKIRNDCHLKALWLTSKYAVPEHEPPVGGLAMCHNWATFTLEQINWYNNIWKDIISLNGPEAERAREENGERVMSAGKILFIFCLSSIEFSMKAASKRHANILQVDFSKRQYLQGLMGKSHAIGLIDRTAKERWDCLSKLRNALVHNNGIADENLDVAFPTEINVIMINGSMTQGNLKMFPKLVRWSVCSYTEWCDAFLGESGLKSPATPKTNANC